MQHCFFYNGVEMIRIHLPEVRDEQIKLIDDVEQFLRATGANKSLCLIAAPYSIFLLRKEYNKEVEQFEMMLLLKYAGTMEPTWKI